MILGHRSASEEDSDEDEDEDESSMMNWVIPPVAAPPKPAPPVLNMDPTNLKNNLVHIPSVIVQFCGLYGIFSQMSSKQLGGAMEDLRGGSKQAGKWEDEEEASTSSSFSKSKTSTTSSSSKSKARWADEDASSVCSDNYQSVHLALPAQPSKARDIEEDDTESEDTLNLMKVHLK